MTPTSTNACGRTITDPEGRGECPSSSCWPTTASVASSRVRARGLNQLPPPRAGEAGDNAVPSMAAGAGMSPAGAPQAAIVLPGLGDSADVLAVAHDGLAAEHVPLGIAVVRLPVGRVLEPAALGDVSQQAAVPVLGRLGAVRHEVDEPTGARPRTLSEASP